MLFPKKDNYGHAGKRLLYDELVAEFSDMDLTKQTKLQNIQDLGSSRILEATAKSGSN